MATLLRTLGGLSIEGRDFTRPKSLLLLAFLALEGPRDRRFLAQLFYPGTARPLGGLAASLARIRGGAPGAIAADGTRAWSLLTCDARDLLNASELGEDRRTIDLYTGPFLDGFYQAGWSGELEEWVYLTRETLAGLVRAAHLRVGEESAAAGDFDTAIRHAERAFRLAGADAPDPATLGRIHTLLMAGESPGAHGVRSEAEGYGVDLAATVEQARDRLIRRSEPGDRRGRARFGSDLTSFVGRRTELSAIEALLDRGARRLLTITGMGGVGKTRLARQVVRRRLEGDAELDGAFFVSLEALDKPEQLLPTIAADLGLESRGAEPPLARITRFLGDRRALLLLDNFETIVDAAPSAAELLRGCPGLTILVTSRERLNVPEETVVPLGGLIPSEGAEERRYRDALTLFEHRARSAHLPFDLTPEVVPKVHRIAHLLEGSPLGIELAAAWIRAMSATEIADEIARDLDFLTVSARTVPERHRSLRAVFDRSWHLLDERGRRILRHLSVFHGGFRREAAREVAHATIADLASMVDRSLIRVLPSGRYDNHPLLLQFARERLEERPEERDDSLERHAHHYLALAQRAEPYLKGSRQDIWLDRMQEEYDNFEAVLSWSLRHDRPLLGLGLADALRRLWLIRDASQQGRVWLQRLLRHPGSRDRTRIRARALRHLGIMARDHGDLRAAIPPARESVAILQELGDSAEVVKSLGLLGTVSLALGDDDRAEELFERCLELARSGESPNGVALALNQMGRVATRRGDLVAARTLLEECLVLTRRLGDRRDIAIPLHHLGLVAELDGKLDAAYALLDESLTIRRELGDLRGIASSLAGLARVTVGRGDRVTARSLLAEGLDLHLDLDDRHGVATCLEVGALIAADEGDDERAARLWGAGEALREALHTQASPDDRRHHTPAIDAARRRLGADPFRRAWSAGSRLTQQQSIDLMSRSGAGESG